MKPASYEVWPKHAVSSLSVTTNTSIYRYTFASDQISDARMVMLLTLKHINTTLLMAALLLVLCACENDIRDIEAIDRKVDNVDRYKDIRITYSDSARIRVLIEAPIMESQYDPNQTQEDRFPKGVRVEFYNDFGTSDSWLSAKKAIRYPDKELVMVQDSVALLSSKGDTLRTEELFWDSKNKEIYTTGAFRYANPKEKIFGYKFRSDQNFEKYTFEKMSGHMQSKLPN